MKITSLLLGLFIATAASAATPELVYVDPAGVIRWKADDREVALFGANYCLPSATDFRAAGYVGADRKKLVEQDMAHFARMGWDAMRLSFWGDWENSDAQGNLIANEHLDVMDYAIAEAKKRGVYILLTPITTYSAWWPDAKATDPYLGFASKYERSELGTNSTAIKAQCNYLRQIMAHVNPYTGVALKDEPAIIFVEMINEPWHHPENFAGAVAYINALAEAVRSTGCQKLLFHNLSQDFTITAALKASTVPGVTFAWYPTKLNIGHALTENHLRSVDEYTPMLRPDIRAMPKIVYEFDSADMDSGYMYPAMTRAFRGAGAQFAAMFSYDMLATAPYNLGWQTHFLNLVYSPKKAVSAIIAAEVMREIPLYSHYGEYPDNRRFGPFRVSYEEDSSEFVTAEKFMYANSTPTAPPDAAKLRQIVGTGSSPLVSYEGNGAYFLDQLASGMWRLEVYPDAVLVQDPFAQNSNYKTISSRLVRHEWPMTVRLPDLGSEFSIAGLNEGNRAAAQAQAGSFAVSPGVYLLSHDKNIDRATLPARVGRVGLNEFVCPAAPQLPAQVLPVVREVYPVDQPVVLAADVVDSVPPASVTLQWRAAGENSFHPVPLTPQQGYRHAVTLPAGAFPVGAIEYYFQAATPAGKIRHPAKAALLTTRVVPAESSLALFDAGKDIGSLLYPQLDDKIRRSVFKTMPATKTAPAALRLVFPPGSDHAPDYYRTALVVKDRIVDRRMNLAKVKSLRVKARSAADGQALYLTLVEADGTAWTRQLSLSPVWREQDIALADLEISRSALLPHGYPGRWNYWSPSAKGRGVAGDLPRLGEIEQVQLSLRPVSAPAGDGAIPQKGETWVEVASLSLLFN
jgi:hypothetical protein